jgi:hypothetical protein
MKLPMIKRSVFFGLILSLLTIVATAWGLEPGKDGYYNTGSGVRTKSVAFLSVKVYSIRHDIKQLPAEKSKRAMIDMDADKKFTWRMMRDVDADKIQDALKDAYKMNGYSDAAKIGTFLGALNKELKEGTFVTISYNAANKTTSLSVSGGGSATVAGADFMKATWSIWFGKIDQPSLGDAMIANM